MGVVDIGAEIIKNMSDKNIFQVLKDNKIQK